jgi:hypothetical protein
MRSVALAVVLSGCAQGFAQAPKADDAPSELAGQTFGVPGETIEYQVALRGVTVGRVVVSVGKPGVVDGHRAIIVRSRGTSAGFVALFGEMRWELTTTLDLDSGLPLHEIEESWVDLKGESNHDREDHDWSGSGYNLHAAAGALRGWQSRVGQRASLEVTIDQLQIDVELSDAAREYLAPANQPAVRYDGIARDKYNFSAWISDDEARVPLLLRTDTKLGRVTIDLVRYDPPSEDR